MDQKIWPEELPPGSQRERRKQVYREKIMDAAILVFEEKGCQQATLEDICDGAGVSRPTFYSYYDSKQDLIFALAEKLWMNVAAELTNLSLAKCESVETYIHAFLTMASDALVKYSRLEKDLIRHSMGGAGSNMNMLYGLTGMFNSIYQEGLNRGELSQQYSSEFLAEMAMGCISTVMMRWADIDEYPVEQRLQQLAGYLCLPLNK